MKLGFTLPKSRRKRARNRIRPRRRLSFQSLESRQLLSGVPLFSEGVNYSLSPIDATESSGEKPQSKVWQYDDQWWAVIPTGTGTGLWQLEQQTWNPVLQLSERTDVQADVKPLNVEAHILLFGGTSSQLVSLEYNDADSTYQPWSAYPSTV